MQSLKAAPNIKTGFLFSLCLLLVTQTLSRFHIALTDSDSQQLADLLAGFLGLLVAHLHDVATGQNVAQPAAAQAGKSS